MPTVSARNFVDQVVADEPVVLFALEWCEFSWSIRKLFTRLGVAFRSVDLDSAAMQENDFGGSVRNALARRVGTRTIPRCSSAASSSAAAARRSTPTPTARSRHASRSTASTTVPIRASTRARCCRPGSIRAPRRKGSRP
ncbi:MAG: glutaredoxin [Gammaproteobacteria bacterium]|nr:glutaredoxin [Gammaproteobacteria bacterium]